jgi:hypothetical protein
VNDIERAEWPTALWAEVAYPDLLTSFGQELVDKVGGKNRFVDTNIKLNRPLVESWTVTHDSAFG